MKTNLQILHLALIGLLALGHDSAGAEDASQEAARRLLTDKGDSVVWLSAVMKISMTAAGSSDSPMNIPDRERKVEGLATIVRASIDIPSLAKALNLRPEQKITLAQSVGYPPKA